MVAFLSTHTALLIPLQCLESDGWKSVQLKEEKKLTFTEHLLVSKHWKSLHSVFHLNACLPCLAAQSPSNTFILDSFFLKVEVGKLTCPASQCTGVLSKLYQSDTSIQEVYSDTGKCEA